MACEVFAYSLSYHLAVSSMILSNVTGPASKYQIGNRVRGKVTSVQNFGAFVEIEPSFSELLHKNELWRKAFDAKNVISVDTEVEACILSIDPKVGFLA